MSLSAQALADFRGRAWPAVRISPGEPFHRIQIDHRWILDWYQLRTSGIAIFGPSPGEVVPPISQTEFVQAVREQLPDWPERVKRNPSAGRLAYAVVTVCRAFRACKTGEYVSKGEAARWAAGELPEFRGVIEDAGEWRYKAGRSTRKPPGPDEARLLSEAVLRLCS
jgi:hypothetical protein